MGDWRGYDHVGESDHVWQLGGEYGNVVSCGDTDSPQSRSYFLLAGLNLLWIPIVYLCMSIYVCFPCWTIELRLTSLIVYPETRNRSLESIDALFSTASPFHWKMEQAYSLRGDVLAEHGVTNQTYQAGKTESSCDRSEVQPAIV